MRPRYLPPDLNEDGKQDLLAGNGRREEIQILLGDGRGGLVKSSTLALHRMPGRYFLALGDVDGDRHVDIVSAVGFADNRPSQVTVHLGDGAAHFHKGPVIEVDAASEGMRLILADMDADALEGPGAEPWPHACCAAQCRLRPLRAHGLAGSPAHGRIRAAGEIWTAMAAWTSPLQRRTACPYY